MNASMLLKLMPMIVMLISLAYAAYAVQWMGTALEPAPIATAGKKDEANGTVRTLIGVLDRGISPGVADSLRDLFQVISNSGKDQAAAHAGPGLTSTEPDPNTAIVERLTLNATLLQGRTQLAVISGRVYRAGQHLDDRSGQPSPLALTKVFAKKVVLEAGGKHYVLAYPENLDSALAARGARPDTANPLDLQDLDPRLALIQALLKSPLGGLGASLLAGGNNGLQAKSDPRIQRAHQGMRPALAPPRPRPAFESQPSSSPDIDQ